VREGEESRMVEKERVRGEVRERVVESEKE